MSITRDLVLSVRARDEASREFAAITRNVNSVGAAMHAAALQSQLFGTAMILGAGAIATGFIGAIKAATDFDKQMRQANVNMQLGNQQFKAMETQVLKLGIATNTMTSELSQGLFYIAGVVDGTQNQFKVLGAASELAATGMAKLQDVAHANVDVMNAFNLSADTATKITGTMAEAVKFGVMTFEDATSSLGRFLPTLSAFTAGMDKAEDRFKLFQSGMAALSAVTRIGLSPETAAMGENRLLSELLNPGRNHALAEALNKLKGVVKDTGDGMGVAAIQTLGFQGTLLALATQANGMQNLAKIFGDLRAARFGFAALAGGGGNLQTVFKQMLATDPATELAKDFNQAAQAVSFQMGQAWKSVQRFAIAIGNELLPYVETATHWLTKFANALTDKGWEGSITKVGLLAGAFLAVQGVVKILQGVFGTMAAFRMMASERMTGAATAEGAAAAGLRASLSETAIAYDRVAMAASRTATTIQATNLAETAAIHPLMYGKGGEAIYRSSYTGTNPLLDRQAAAEEAVAATLMQQARLNAFPAHSAFLDSTYAARSATAGGNLVGFMGGPVTEGGLNQIRAAQAAEAAARASQTYDLSGAAMMSAARSTATGLMRTVISRVGPAFNAALIGQLGSMAVNAAAGGSRFAEIAGPAFQFGGAGAAIGTMISGPGVGTAIGAGVGGGIGALIGFMHHTHELTEAEKTLKDLSATSGLTSSQLSQVAVVLGVDVAHASASARQELSDTAAVVRTQMQVYGQTFESVVGTLNMAKTITGSTQSATRQEFLKTIDTLNNLETTTTKVFDDITNKVSDSVRAFPDLKGDTLAEQLKNLSPAKLLGFVGGEQNFFASFFTNFDLATKRIAALPQEMQASALTATQDLFDPKNFAALQTFNTMSKDQANKYLVTLTAMYDRAQAISTIGQANMLAGFADFGRNFARDTEYVSNLIPTLLAQGLSPEKITALLGQIKAPAKEVADALFTDFSKGLVPLTRIQQIIAALPTTKNFRFNVETSFNGQRQKSLEETVKNVNELINSSPVMKGAAQLFGNVDINKYLLSIAQGGKAGKDAIDQLTGSMLLLLSVPENARSDVLQQMQLTINEKDPAKVATDISALHAQLAALGVDQYTVDLVLSVVNLAATRDYIGQPVEVPVILSVRQELADDPKHLGTLGPNAPHSGPTPKSVAQTEAEKWKKLYNDLLNQQGKQNYNGPSPYDQAATAQRESAIEQAINRATSVLHHGSKLLDQEFADMLNRHGQTITVWFTRMGKDYSDAVNTLNTTVQKGNSLFKDGVPSALQDMEDALTARTQSIGDKLRALTDVLAKFEDAVRSGFRANNDIVGAFGSAPQVTKREIVEYFKEAAQRAKEFAAVLIEMQKRGFRRDLIEQVAAAGPTAIGVARGLLDAGAGYVNTQVHDLGTLVAGTATSLESQLFHKEISDMTKALHSLHDAEIKLINTMLAFIAKLPRHAAGGISNGPELTMWGEGGYNEVILSTDPAMRGRNRDLLYQSGLARDFGSMYTRSNGSSPQVVNVQIAGKVETPEEIADKLLWALKTPGE